MAQVTRRDALRSVNTKSAPTIPIGALAVDASIAARAWLAHPGVLPPVMESKELSGIVTIAAAAIHRPEAGDFGDAVALHPDALSRRKARSMYEGGVTRA